MRLRSAIVYAAAVVLALTAGCKKAGTDAGSDAAPRTDAGGDAAPGTDAGGGGTDSTVGTDSGAAMLARGQYLVDHVADCGGCHTPFDPVTMTPGPYLSGNPCLIDVDPMTAGAGCLSTANLTNHATGLMGHSDAEVRALVTMGEHPGGVGFLNPFMPYWIFANMTTEDIDAIIAYLRTVAGVDNTITPEPPFDVPETVAVPAIDMATVPMPDPATPDLASAMNGRYLAAAVGACIDCHTPETAPGSFMIDRTRFFEGGREFPAALLGLPVPPFPDVIYSFNLTPDSTGIMGRTPTDIVNELLMGTDPGGGGICPPMPAGPMFAFGGLTMSDAMDLANYFFSIPAVANALPNGCVAP